MKIKSCIDILQAEMDYFKTLCKIYIDIDIDIDVQELIIKSSLERLKEQFSLLTKSMENKECKLRNYTSNGFIDLTCSHVRKNIENMKKKYRDDNGTDIVEAKGKFDRPYREYCKSLDKFLMQCNCVEEPLTCKKCTLEEHEGHFCRCESRNIKLARQLREKKYIGH